MANDNSKKSLGALLEASVPGAPGTLNEVVTGALAGVGGGGVTEQFSQLTQQLEQLQTVDQAQRESTLANTQALNQNTTQLGQAGSPASKTAGTLQSFGLGLGLSPLITGLLSLFGGGGSGSSPTAAPVKFSLPPSVGVNAGVSEAAPTSPFGVDYAAGGQPRPATAGALPQITVQVQALDSQSFLDHSQDIAMAVRQAMLESGVLNDVIREI